MLRVTPEEKAEEIRKSECNGFAGHTRCSRTLLQHPPWGEQLRHLPNTPEQASSSLSLYQQQGKLHPSQPSSWVPQRWISSQTFLHWPTLMFSQMLPNPLSTCCNLPKPSFMGMPPVRDARPWREGLLLGFKDMVAIFTLSFSLKRGIFV